MNGRVKPEDGDWRLREAKAVAERHVACSLRFGRGRRCPLEGAGMVRGKAAPTTFDTAATGTRCVVHDDNFAFVTLAMNSAADECLAPDFGAPSLGDVEQTTTMKYRCSRGR